MQGWVSQEHLIGKHPVQRCSSVVAEVYCGLKTEQAHRQTFVFPSSRQLCGKTSCSVVFPSSDALSGGGEMLLTAQAGRIFGHCISFGSFCIVFSCL